MCSQYRMEQMKSAPNSNSYFISKTTPTRTGWFLYARFFCTKSCNYVSCPFVTRLLPKALNQHSDKHEQGTHQSSINFVWQQRMTGKAKCGKKSISCDSRMWKFQWWLLLFSLQSRFWPRPFDFLHINLAKHSRLR